MDLDRERWTALSDAGAEALAARIADRLGAASVRVRPHEYAGRRNRIAVFDLGGEPFALVPGGRARVGYDAVRFVPTADQVDSYRESVEEYGIPLSIHEYVDAYTSPARTVEVPALLVSVEAVQAGLTEVAPDDPAVARRVEQLRSTAGATGGDMPRQVTWHGFGRALLGPDGTVHAAWRFGRPTHGGEVARLAAIGQRLLTPDEWEYACGAGAASLFRWGDACPAGPDPYSAASGPHREPNLFGLLIGQDPYRDERTADPAVVCGGDGGGMVCGGAGEFVSWLTVATAYRDPDHAEFIQREGEHLDQMLIRPAIPVPDTRFRPDPTLA
ncbi:hypothetical protein [Dactylosporangium salmoneum]|uniref:Sulfatase-modifying factor enzyme domain-containing protein n=1 Tax=Dactylosporangium salmoneum TaxID=53361 RepID=A0ABN3GXU9_9ACTN